jgi:hypothetical protein
MRYKAVFEELTVYEVEFDHDDEIDPTNESQWFEALEAADPNWWHDKSNISSVNNRELVRLEKVEPRARQQASATSPHEPCVGS